MDRHLPHLDQRLGHVAVDMGLLTQDEAAEIERQMVMQNASAGVDLANFHSVAVELACLTPDQLEAVRNEELRRRRLISGFEIIDLLGAGLIATVYLAWQFGMERHVALKILHPRLAQDPEFVKSYIAEAQAVSRFHHPHIVQGFDAGESNGFYYFSHEYLAGGSMADRLNSPDGARFSETQLLGYLRQTTSALKHAWAVAVYHGDINPGNLLLDSQDTIKLANLGVPRMARAKDADLGGHAPGSVRSGPEYAAPEQLEHPEIVNASTDMYNLGATFYHLSFGALPFPGATREAVQEYRRHNPQPSFSLKRQERFSGKYLRLIHDMLDYDPEKRPANPEELAGRLEMFHLSDLDELTWRVRRESDPSSATRTFARRSASPGRMPNSAPGGRLFSLRPRRENMRPGRSGLWALSAAVLLGVALAVWLFC